MIFERCYVVKNDDEEAVGYRIEHAGYWNFYPAPGAEQFFAHELRQIINRLEELNSAN